MTDRLTSKAGQTNAANSLAINSFIIAILMLFFVSASPAFAVHSSSSSLEPEWSAAGQNMNYIVTFYNNASSTHAIGEVRIYKNEQYTNFVCNPKTGWYLSEPAPGICNYYALPQNTNSIPPGGSAQFTFSATTPAQGCEWTWQFETRDVTFPNQGSINYLSDTTSVDSLAPTINKTLSGTVLEKDGTTWITQDTNLNIEVYDNGDQCGLSGLNYCRYRYDLDGVEEQPWTIINWDRVSDNKHYYYTLNYDEDSEHHLEIECYDNAGNRAYHEQTEKVDSTKPETTKTYGDPHYPANINNGGAYPHYIDTTTPITLTAVDPEAPTTPQGVDCSVDGVKTYYRDFVVKDNEICMSENLCNPEYFGNPELEFTEYTGPIYKNEESCHVLEYYSVDALGNQEETKYQCVYVEDKAPIVSADTGYPKVPCSETDPSKCDYYVRDHKTPITLSCYDPSPHPSGVKSIEYRWKLDGAWPTNNPNGVWLPYEKPIIFEEDSIHTLEYRCTDNLGHVHDGPGKIYRVDSVAPNITKTMIGNYLPGEVNGQCPPDPNSNDVCYVADNGQSGVHVSVTDPDPTEHGCNVGGITCNYDVTWESSESECTQAEGEWLDNGLCLLDSGTFGEEEDILFREDSTHHVNIACSDALGNSVEESEKFLVDSTPPVTEKVYGEPTEVRTVGEDTYRWITSATPITLTATDEKVGVEKISYRVTQIPGVDYPECMEACDYTSEAGDFEDVPGDEAEFTIGEDSCHLIEFQSTDKLGYTETMKRQCVFVDNKAPITTKTIGEPKVIRSGGLGDNGVVNVLLMHANYHEYMQDVFNKLSAYPDLNVSELDVKYITPNLTDLMNYDAVFLYDNYQVADSVAMGNVLADYADNGGGVVLAVFDWYNGWKIQGRYMTEQYGAIPMGNTSTPYTSGTLGVFDSTHPVMQGVTAFNTSDYRSGTKYLNPGATLVASYTDGEVLVAVKENGTRRGCDLGFFPPSSDVINSWNSKTNGSLIMHNCIVWAANGGIGGSIYINQSTPITLTCNDQEPHPVHNESLYYRYNVNGTQWTNWTHGVSGQPFTFPQDSNHTLEYYCVDGLGNTELVKTEVDIVDSQAPEITTTIVGPHYFKSENMYVDGVTKIHVEAVDPTPHPVGGVKCDWSYTVRQNQSAHGGQTGVSAPFDINFPEESTHDLKITCKDELGNEATVYGTYQVDKTPPTTTSDYEGPYYSNETAEWITSQTDITLSVEDTGDHKSGIKKTEYRVTRLGAGDENNAPCLNRNVCQEQSGGDSVWKTYTGEPFQIDETSCHLIEYRSVDNVNKTETTKKQCVFVDNEKPEPVKTVGEPKTKWDGVNPQNVTYYPGLPERCAQEDCWKVTTLTPITMSCDDRQPHPVDHSKISFNVNFDNMADLTSQYCNEIIGNKSLGKKRGSMVGGVCVINNSVEKASTLYFVNESNHNLKFYCTDALGNKGETDDEMFKVDGTRFELNLYKKWNLISVPFVLLNDTPEALFKDVKDNITAVWAYDNGTWLIWTPGPAPDTLHSIKPGWGYWVLSNDRRKIWIGGSLLSPVTIPPARPLAAGWNLIGFYGTEWQQYGADPDCSYDVGPIFWDYTYNALNSLVDLQQGYPRWESLYTRVNCKNDQWVIQRQTEVMADKYNSKNKMVAGYGYWIHMDLPDEYAP